MRRTWNEVATTLAALRRRFEDAPSPSMREAQLAALEQIAHELALAFGRRSPRFDERRFFEIIRSG